MSNRVRGCLGGQKGVEGPGARWEGCALRPGLRCAGGRAGVLRCQAGKSHGNIHREGNSSVATVLSRDVLEILGAGLILWVGGRAGGSSACVGAAQRTDHLWTKGFSLSLGSPHASGALVPSEGEKRGIRPRVSWLVGARRALLLGLWGSASAQTVERTGPACKECRHTGSWEEPHLQEWDTVSLPHSQTPPPKAAVRENPGKGGIGITWANSVPRYVRMWMNVYVCV